MSAEVFIRGLRSLAALLAAAAVFVFAPNLCSQVLVDRIVARVEGDIITQSEVRELGALQLLFDQKAAPEEELLNRLIDQWIVSAEMKAAKFPQPSPEDVNRVVASLEQQYGSAASYRARVKELGLLPEDVTRLILRQLQMTRYLDYKFRPAAQVAPADVERYYREEFAPALTRRGEHVPPLEGVREQIGEVLTQKEINVRGAAWLEETRARLKVERLRQEKRR